MKNILKVLPLLICIICLSGARYCKEEHNVRIYHLIHISPNPSIRINPSYLWQVQTARYVGKIKIDENLKAQYEFFNKSDIERMNNFLGALKTKEIGISYLEIFKKKPSHLSINQTMRNSYNKYLVKTSAQYPDKDFWNTFEKSPLGGFGVGRYNVIAYKTGERYFKNGWREEKKKYDFKNAMANNCCLIWYPPNP